MSAEQVHDYASGPDYDDPREPVEYLNTAKNSVGEEIDKIEARLALLQAFYNFCEDKGIDALTEDNGQSRPLSHVAHDFVHDMTEKNLDRLRDKHPKSHYALLDYKHIARNIDEFYDRFGDDRHALTGPKLHDAYDYIKESEQGLLHREEAFPEIYIARELYSMLRRHSHPIAGDSVETLLVAYGQRASRMINFTSHYHDYERKSRRIIPSIEILLRTDDEK